MLDDLAAMEELQFLSQCSQKMMQAPGKQGKVATIVAADLKTEGVKKADQDATNEPVDELQKLREENKRLKKTLQQL